MEGNKAGLNMDFSFEEKVGKLLSEMTLEEKIGQLRAKWLTPWSQLFDIFRVVPPEKSLWTLCSQCFSLRGRFPD